MDRPPVLAATIAGQQPGPEASVRTLLADQHGRDTMDLARDLAGADGLLEGAGPLGDESHLEAARTTLQVHGGTGFTWDHPARLYSRRAKSDELLLGTPAEHRAALADLLGI